MPQLPAALLFLLVCIAESILPHGFCASVCRYSSQLRRCQIFLRIGQSPYFFCPVKAILLAGSLAEGNLLHQVFLSKINGAVGHFRLSEAFQAQIVLPVNQLDSRKFL